MSNPLDALWSTILSGLVWQPWHGLMGGPWPQAHPLQRGSGALGSFSDDGRDEDGGGGLDDDLLTGSIGERDPMLAYHGAVDVSVQ